MQVYQSGSLRIFWCLFDFPSLLLVSVSLRPPSSILKFISSTKLSSLLPPHPCFLHFHLDDSWTEKDLDVEVFSGIHHYVEIHIIGRFEWLSGGRNVHLCHGFLVDFYQFVRPVTFKSQLKVDVPDVHRLVFHPTVSSTSGLTGRQKKKIDAVSFLLFLFLSFNWKTQGAPSIPRHKLSCFYCLFILSSRLLDQSFRSCHKQTDEWMDVTSVRLLIYKQTRRLFFKRKLYETFEFCWFDFVWFYLVSPAPSPSWSFFLQEEEDSSETVLIPTRRNNADTTDRCNKTLEFGKTHTNTHICTHL